MRLLKWLKSRCSIRGRCLWLYNEAIAKAKNHDRRGAIDDYTATIDMRGVPSDVKAMALYNRALVHTAAKDNPKAIDDLNSVLAMEEPLANIKTAVKQRFARMGRRRSKSENPCTPRRGAGKMRVRGKRKKSAAMEERKATRDKEAAERRDRKEKRVAIHEEAEIARAQKCSPDGNKAAELQEEVMSMVRKKEQSRARRGRRGFRSGGASAAGV